MRSSSWLLAGAILLGCNARGSDTPTTLKPDIIVAANGGGNFKTIQAALQSVPRSNQERKIILVKNGLYREKVRVDASFITLRGESRQGTRLEFSQIEDDFNKNKDDLGRAVINVNKASDFVLENLTAANTAEDVNLHEFVIFGTGDRTVILNCDLLSEGADTVALWQTQKGRYYHAGCHFRGSSDYLCPRGWCYVTNCTFYGTKKGGSATWHDGSSDADKKLVLRNCKFDGVEGWKLGRHQTDAQFYYLDCSFSSTMADKAPFRVDYRDNARKTAEVNSDILWGERIYFQNCHRLGGDYEWHRDNLASATNSVPPEEVTAAWTFAGTWDPERKTPPIIRKVSANVLRVALSFDEAVTVKGKLRLILERGAADCSSGSGTNTLTFLLPSQNLGAVRSLDLSNASIIACQAGATLRMADPTLPPPGQKK
jgi:pectinesterase